MKYFIALLALMAITGCKKESNRKYYNKYQIWAKVKPSAPGMVYFTSPSHRDSMTIDTLGLTYHFDDLWGGDQVKAEVRLPAVGKTTLTIFNVSKLMTTDTISTLANEVKGLTVKMPD